MEFALNAVFHILKCMFIIVVLLSETKMMIPILLPYLCILHYYVALVCESVFHIENYMLFILMRN